MAYEIEIKAWLTDPEALLRRLEGRTEKVKEYVKDDVYYRAPVPPPLPGITDAAAPAVARGGEPQEFRLRRQGGENTCTFKEKSIRRGVEVNRELEFTVSDPEAFHELVLRSGCSVFARKKKTGRVFSLAEADVEVSHVDGLGDFVEIEKIVEQDDAAHHDAAEQAVRGLLEDLGIGEEAIEARPYTQMLAERGHGISAGAGADAFAKPGDQR